METLARAINRNRQQVAALKTELTALDHKIARAADESRLLDARIARNTADVSRRLVALYKLNRLGTANLLASAGSDYHGPEHPWIELGRLPELPPGCRAIWRDWPLNS